MMVNKFALITGSCHHRLGWHIAQALGKAGIQVGVHSRSRDAAVATVNQFKSEGGQAHAFSGDLADESQVEAIFQQIKQSWGRIDVLVNCASVWESKPLEKTSAQDVRKHFEANILAPFLCARAAGELMILQPEGGCIINFGDWAESRPYPGYSAYFAVKGAIPAMTRSLAVEFALKNPTVRVNCILPGPVLFPDNLPAEEIQEAIAGTLLRRKGEPENIVQAVKYLMENDFVTGSSLVVDGGRSVWAGPG
ncbi:MAG: SDR family oxidoreductase [Gemmataceae bacterium]|nr:SDR family oxidoreductase [Gemmataceae bacterium]